MSRAKTTTLTLSTRVDMDVQWLVDKRGIIRVYDHGKRISREEADRRGYLPFTEFEDWAADSN